MEKLSTSTKLTKKAIVDRYNELLESISADSANTEIPTPNLVKSLKRDLSPRAVIEDVGSAKAACISAFDDVASMVNAEADRLVEIRGAVEEAEELLKHRHAIIAAADTLDALAATQVKAKEEFNKLMDARHAELDESISTKRREWKREQDEYAYATETQRIRDEAELQKDKEEWARQIAERESILSQRESKCEVIEQDLATIRENHAEEIKHEVESAQARVKDALGSQFGKEIALLEQRVETLTMQLASSQAQVLSLREEVKESNARASEIAEKAVSTQSVIRMENRA